MKGSLIWLFQSTVKQFNWKDQKKSSRKTLRSFYIL